MANISVNYKFVLIIKISTSDNGIPADFNKRIFDPFVTTKRGQGGSGLGLHIVFNLVDAKLGGTIKLLESEQGVCFKVKVPIVQVKEKKLLVNS